MRHVGSVSQSRWKNQADFCYRPCSVARVDEVHGCHEGRINGATAFSGEGFEAGDDGSEADEQPRPSFLLVNERFEESNVFSRRI
jgi:hypothetical protein